MRALNSPIRAVLTLFMIVSMPAVAATQTYSGDIIQISVQDNLSPGIFVKPATAAGPGDPYIEQYFGGYSWGSVVHINGEAFGSSSGNLGPVSNALTTTADGASITTVVDLGGTGVRLTQTITYLNGTRYITKEWQLSNTGEATYNGVKFIHGGDTYFGGDDAATGYYDPANSMVYIRNTDYNNWGIMGFYANPSTPASAYFEGFYAAGYSYADAGQLPNTVDPNYLDAGYQLQWNRALLAPGETWTIQAYETWTPAGGVQVLSPGNQNAASNSVSTLPFTLQNLTESDMPVTVSASTDQPTWVASIVGSTTPTIPAQGSVTVNVQVAVPSDATGSANITLNASSSQPPSSATTSLTAINLAIAIDPASVDFGFVANGNTGTNTVTVQNLSGVPVVLGNLATFSPFSVTADSCSGMTLAVNAACTVNVNFMPVTSNVFTANLNVPVLSPALVTRTVPLSGASVTYPVTVTTNPTERGTASCTPNPVGYGGTSTCTHAANPGYTLANWDGDCSGVSCVLNNVTVAKSVTALFAPVTSVTAPTATGTGNATIAVAGAGCAISAAQFVPAPAGTPANMAYPHGLADFTLLDCAGSATVTITYPQPIPAGAKYWKENGGTYAEFPASFGTHSVTFTLSDNGAGDSDPTVGVIHDPSGIGVTAASGNGGAQSIPVLGSWALALLAGLMGLGAVWARRRWA